MARNDSSPRLAQLPLTPLTDSQYNWPCLLALSRSTAGPRRDTGMAGTADREQDAAEESNYSALLHALCRPAVDFGLLVIALSDSL